MLHSKVFECRIQFNGQINYIGIDRVQYNVVPFVCLFICKHDIDTSQIN